MRRPLILLGLLLVAGIACACGDKLMLVMGARYSQIKPLHPAAILAYPGQLPSGAVIRAMQSLPAFKKAGHHVQLVEDTTAFDSALKAGKYDVVIADVTNVNELSQHVSAAASKAIVLPVAFRATKDQQSAAQKKYHCLLKAPGDTGNYLAAIDQAMELRLKGKAQ